MDELKLDPQVLENTASLIIIYCQKQKLIMDEYLRQISRLQSEWDDDQTFGKVIQEIRQLEKSVNDIMDMIRYKYPEYFIQLAQNIRQRPKLDN